jgi:hypothetical protein
MRLILNRAKVKSTNKTVCARGRAIKVVVSNSALFDIAAKCVLTSSRGYLPQRSEKLRSNPPRGIYVLRDVLHSFAKLSQF